MDHCPQLLEGDALQLLPSLPSGCASLAYVDPPFNTGLDYPDYQDRLPREKYLSWLRQLLTACRRVLSSTGTLWLQMGSTGQAEALLLLKDIGFHHRQTIIWHYTFGPNQQKRFPPCWQALHYMTMHPRRFTFNANAVRVPSWRIENGDRRADPRGKVMSDVWSIPRLPGNARERVKDGNGKGHSCQTPEEVLRRIVLACSSPGELVIDPVAGTGTTLAVAARHGRRAVGIEMSPRTAALARSRLTGLQTGPEQQDDPDVA